MLCFIVAGIVVTDGSLWVVCSGFKCFILVHVVKVIISALLIAVAVAVINATKKMKLRREL